MIMSVYKVQYMAGDKLYVGPKKLNETTGNARETVTRIVCRPVNIRFLHVHNLVAEFYCYYNFVGDFSNTAH